LPLTVTIDEPTKVVEMVEELAHSSALIKALDITITDDSQFDLSAYDLKRLQHLDLKLPQDGPFNASKLLDLIQIEEKPLFKLSFSASGPSARTIVEHRVLQHLVHASICVRESFAYHSG
jgi:hypothetical protein